MPDTPADAEPCVCPSATSSQQCASGPWVWTCSQTSLDRHSPLLHRDPKIPSTVLVTSLEHKPGANLQTTGMLKSRPRRGFSASWRRCYKLDVSFSINQRSPERDHQRYAHSMWRDTTSAQAVPTPDVRHAHIGPSRIAVSTDACAGAGAKFVFVPLALCVCVQTPAQWSASSVYNSGPRPEGVVGVYPEMGYPGYGVIAAGQPGMVRGMMHQGVPLQQMHVQVCKTLAHNYVNILPRGRATILQRMRPT